MNVPIGSTSDDASITGIDMLKLMLSHGLHRKLEAFARSLVNDLNQADALAQSTCIWAWKFADKIRSTDEKAILRWLQTILRDQYMSNCRNEHNQERYNKRMPFDICEFNLALDRVDDEDVSKYIPGSDLHILISKMRRTDCEIEEYDLRVVLIRMIKENMDLRIFMREYACTIDDMLALVEYWMSNAMPLDRHLRRAFRGIAEALDSSRADRLQSRDPRELLVRLLLDVKFGWRGPIDSPPENRALTGREAMSEVDI